MWRLKNNKSTLFDFVPLIIPTDILTSVTHRINAYEITIVLQISDRNKSDD